MLMTNLKAIRKKDVRCFKDILHPEQYSLMVLSLSQTVNTTCSEFLNRKNCKTQTCIQNIPCFHFIIKVRIKELT